MHYPKIIKKCSLQNICPNFKYIFFYLLIVLVWQTSVLLTGCGKRRPPVPPASRPNLNRSQLTGFQRGDQIILQISLQGLNGLSAYKQADVFRLAEMTDSPQFLPEDDFASRSTIVGSISIPANATNASTLTFTDSLNLKGQSIRLRYAVRFVNREGQKTAFSTFTLIEPLVNIADAPTLNDVKVTQDSINLKWLPPVSNNDQSQPANIVGYNVYRTTNNQTDFLKLNTSLLSELVFGDKNFEFGRDYVYFIRAVSVGPDGTQIESADSNQIKIKPIDTFPPVAPEGVTIAAAPGRLSLFFVPNSESDAAGYNVYRTTDSNLPPDRWRQINEQPLTTTTFQDSNIESGTRYFYYLTAVDKAGNTSAPSEIVSEVAP